MAYFKRMTQAFFARLPNRGIVRLSGPDARTLLQGVVTNDVLTIPPDEARYAALLTPQGKIIVDFFVSEEPVGFFIDCPRALAADLVRRLGLYRLRAKVVIEDASATLGVAAVWGAGLDGRRDPRHPALGRRIIGPPDALQAAASLANAGDYEAHRIRCGVAEGGVDFVYGDAFPHEADMDRLHGVDFHKGCYVGQEVVSRVEHRGLARRRVIAVQFSDAPPAGAQVTADGANLGVLTSVGHGVGLAMVRVDRAAEATDQGLAIEADGVALTLDLAPFRRPSGAAMQAG